jgi:hypothetical protein
MEQHLLDGHRFLAVARELRNVVRDGTVDVEQPLADQQPHRGRDDRLGRRVHGEAGVVGRVAERLEAEQRAVARHRDLARGCGTALDEPLGRGEQFVDRTHAASLVPRGVGRQSGHIAC